MRCGGGYVRRRLCRNTVVVREEKSSSRMSGKGLGLGRVWNNEVVLRVLNIEHVEGCSSWRGWHINTPSQFHISPGSDEDPYRL